MKLFQRTILLLALICCSLLLGTICGVAVSMIEVLILSDAFKIDLGMMGNGMLALTNISLSVCLFLWLASKAQAKSIIKSRSKIENSTPNAR
jgi:hypothetical protein